MEVLGGRPRLPIVSPLRLFSQLCHERLRQVKLCGQVVDRLVQAPAKRLNHDPLHEIYVRRSELLAGGSLILLLKGWFFFLSHAHLHVEVELERLKCAKQLLSQLSHELELALLPHIVAISISISLVIFIASASHPLCRRFLGQVKFLEG